VRRPLQGVEYGDLLSRVSTDIVALHQGLIRGPAVLAPHGATAVLLLVAMLGVSWRLTIGTILLVVPMLIAVRLFGRRLQRAAHASQERSAALTAFIHECLRGLREVKIFGREAFIAGRAAELNRAWMHQVLDEERLAILHPATVTLASIVGLS